MTDAIVPDNIRNPKDDDVETWLEQLTPYEAARWRLYAYLPYTYREISDLEHVTFATVPVRIQAAKNFFTLHADTTLYRELFVEQLEMAKIVNLGVVAGAMDAGSKRKPRPEDIARASRIVIDIIKAQADLIRLTDTPTPREIARAIAAMEVQANGDT